MASVQTDIPAATDRPRLRLPTRVAALWQSAWIRCSVNLLGLIAASLVIWFCCVWMFTRHNDFPGEYHTDEFGKVEQLASGYRNYNHPQLMLEAALWLTPSPAGRDPEEMVHSDRVVSAYFGAATAVLMAWAGYAVMGWPGFLCMGVAVGLCPALLSHAHYFKEDESLMFGIAAVLCTGAWLMRARRPGALLWMLIALGVACGVAASGKYCGVVMLGPAILVALIGPAVRKNWPLALAGPLIVIVFAAATWACINWRITNDFEHFINSFKTEQEHSVTDHRGITMDRPNPYFARLTWREAMPHVKVLSILALPAMAVFVWRKRRWSSIAFGAWLLAAMVVYSIMLSYSVIPFYRYTMPVTVMLYAFAGLTLAWIAASLPRQWQRIAMIAGGVILIGAAQGARCADYTHQFADDSRDALRRWVWANLPAGANIAADNYAMVDYAGPQGPGPISRAVNVALTLGVEPFYAGPVSDLRRRGVSYVITVGSWSERFVDPNVKPNSDRVRRAMHFYRDLQSYPVIWSRIAAHPMWTFTNPDITVYDVAKPIPK